MAVAIDGEIYQDAYLAAFNPDSEIYLIDDPSGAAGAAGVMAAGTARRLGDVYRASNGAPLQVGGKTGTDDNRFDRFGAGGRLISQGVVDRTATLVFFLGDRFFGTITAYVPGSVAHCRGATRTSWKGGQGSGDAVEPDRRLCDDRRLRLGRSDRPKRLH
jgi:hypothetical protein